MFYFDTILVHKHLNNFAKKNIMKKIISTREFRKNMKLYLDDVDMGSEVIITRKGKFSYSIVALHDCKTAVKCKIQPS